MNEPPHPIVKLVDHVHSNYTFNVPLMFAPGHIEWTCMFRPAYKNLICLIPTAANDG